MGEPAGNRARVPWAGLALLLVGCALLRGWLILAPPDDFFENGAIPHEELLRGVAAQELLDGPLAPLQRYQVNNFWGGSLVVSLLATVPFAALGPTIVALRLVPLAFGLACVLFAFLLLRRHAGPRAAWIGAGLLACAPPGYAMSSCTAYGTHVEANALALLLVWLVLEEDAHGVRRPWLRPALGAAAGFALWFGFSLILVLAVWLAHEFARDRAFLLRRRMLPILLGFAAGFSPWIRYQLVHGYSGLEVYESGLAGHVLYGVSRGRAAEKLLDTVARSGPQSLAFRDSLGVDGLWLGRVLVVLALCVVLHVAWLHRARLADLARACVRGSVGAARPRPTPATLCLGYLAAFGLAFVFTAFDAAERDWIFDLRYLMPPVPFVCVVAGIAGAAWARRSDAARRFVLAGALLIAGTCAAGTLLQASPERRAANAREPAVSRPLLVRFLARSFASREDEAVGVVERIRARREPPVREELLSGLGRGWRALSALPVRTPAEARMAAATARTHERIRASLPAADRRVFEGAP